TDDALALGSRILEELRQPFRAQEKELFITPSIGISLYPLNGHTAQMLITQADAAMYNAKQEGRNGCRLFASEMSTFFPERLTLENDLRHALTRREFELHYQPQVDLLSDKMMGMEGLLRWHHPTKGLIGPAEFIP